MFIKARAFMLPFFACLTLFTSCSKQDDYSYAPESATQKKTVSEAAIVKLEKKYSRYHLTITRTPITGQTGRTITADDGVTEQQLNDFVDSREDSIDNSFPSVSQSLDVAQQSTPEYKLYPGDAPGGCGANGNYQATGIPSGGLMSSFNMYYTLNGGNISNVGLSLQGMTFGWWWNTGTAFTNGLSGTILGTATYFYGAFTINYNFTFHWYLNLNDCTIYYHWS